MWLTEKLQESRPSLTLEQVLAAVGIEPRYEGVDDIRQPSGEPKRFRVYTLSGHLLEGSVILIPADMPALAADQMAFEGMVLMIEAGIESLRSINDEIMPSTEVRRPGLKGLSAEDRQKFARMFADRQNGRLH